jgi:hypothetical protein
VSELQRAHSQKSLNSLSHWASHSTCIVKCMSHKIIYKGCLHGWIGCVFSSVDNHYTDRHQAIACSRVWILAVQPNDAKSSVQHAGSNIRIQVIATTKGSAHTMGSVAALLGDGLILEFLVMHPGLPGVLRRFKTALLYPRPNRRDIMSGWLLSSRALPPAKYHKWIFYFEGVSESVQRPWAGRYWSGVSRKSIVGTAASVHGSKVVGVACFELGVSIRWVGDWQFYLSPTGACAPVTRWPCVLIGHLV